MRKRHILFICVLLSFIAGNVSAQVNNGITSPVNAYKEGRKMFLRKNYAAAMPLLREVVKKQAPEELVQEAEYMMVCSAYELNEPGCIDLLTSYVGKYPDTPHTFRINALCGAYYFFQEDYKKALSFLLSTQIDLLEKSERDNAAYQIALSYLKTGKLDEANIRFEAVKALTPRYQKDCAYYIAYIRYTQKKYDEALKGFLPLQDDPKYRTLAPYYIAEIYLHKKHLDKAEIVAQSYLSAYPKSEYASEMYRILGEVYYTCEQYAKAVTSFEKYIENEKAPKRNALYMAGLSYYRLEVYSKALTMLEQVVSINDEITQNAYYHLGLSYLQRSEKNKARMAFEQAATLNTDRAIKEKAAYNHALCIHETSFSAFGESVTVFERFLNEFPQSSYTEKVSSYLVETYMNTRSYEAALKSIERLSRPGTPILEAKQKILFQLGTQAFANAQFAQAVSYFDRSISEGQYNPQTKADAFYWRGEAYFRMNDMTKAARNFNDYLQSTRQKNNEMYALAHYNLGYTAFNQKDYTKALAWFETYIKLNKEKDQTVADACNRIGDCHLHTRRFEEAKQYYSQAESMETESGDYSFYQMGLVLGMQKDYVGKIAVLNRLIGKYPDSPYLTNALYEKGRSYLLMNNNEQAVITFQELAKKYPESPTARMAAAEIGLLHYQDGEYDKAIEAYKYVIEKYPGSDEARTSLRDLKSVYMDLNRVSEFASVVAALPGNIRLEASEQDSLTYTAAENIYMRGKVREAKSSFDNYLQTFPEGAFSLNARYYLCVIGREEKDYDAVLLHSSKLIEYPDIPFSEQVLIIRSEVQYRLQQYVDALTTYKMLKEKASGPDIQLSAQTGILRCAFLTNNDEETIEAATGLLSTRKLTPELTTEATYCRAKSYLNQKNNKAALEDLKILAKDTRNSYGAEAKFLVANQLYTEKKYEEAEREILDFIDQSTPHPYWLARGFILLSDVYVAMNRQLDARQYLLSLQQNYKADDHIESMIESRLRKLNQ